MEDPDFNELRNIILPEAKKQPDRAFVIVMAAVIEDHLSQALAARLVDNKKTMKKLFEGTGPLASFSAKIDIGLLVGLYQNDFFEMLHAVRKIRNTFAHNMQPLTLESDDIQKDYKGLDHIEKHNHARKKRTPREKFSAASAYILGGLYARSENTVRLK